MTKNITRHFGAVTASAAVLSGMLIPATGAMAQTGTYHRPNVVQRHPTATGVAAGVATHHALKVSAHNKKRRGQRLSWAERHPTLSGLAAAAGTRHVIKKTTHP